MVTLFDMSNLFENRARDTPIHLVSQLFPPPGKSFLSKRVIIDHALKDPLSSAAAAGQQQQCLPVYTHGSNRQHATTIVLKAGGDALEADCGEAWGGGGPHAGVPAIQHGVGQEDGRLRAPRRGHGVRDEGAIFADVFSSLRACREDAANELIIGTTVLNNSRKTLFWDLSYLS